MTFTPQKIVALYRGDKGYGSRGIADTTTFPIYAGSKPIEYVKDSDISVQMYDTMLSLTTYLVEYTDYIIVNENVKLINSSLQPNDILAVFLNQEISQPYDLMGASA